MNFAFIVSTDTQFQIAEEIAQAFREQDPKGELWLISRRWYKFGKEYDASLVQRSFSRLVSPTRKHSILHRLENRLLHSLAPNRPRRPHTPRPQDAYPELFPAGKPVRFDFVFTLNDVPTIDFIKLFQTARVPVALVQESIRRDDADGKGKGLMNGQGNCDVIYAWGTSSADYYRRVGVSPDRIVLTGNPRLDRLACKFDSLPSARELKRDEGFPVDKPLVLVATGAVYVKKLIQPLPLADYLYSIARVVDWCGDIGAFVLLKPHPRELKDHQAWQVPQWIGSFPNAIYRHDIDLVRAIKASDAVVVFNSTAALEAVALGKPSGMLAAGRYSHTVDFLERGISHRIESREDLSSLLCSRMNARIGEYLVATKDSARNIVEDVLKRCAVRPTAAS